MRDNASARHVVIKQSVDAKEIIAMTAIKHSSARIAMGNSLNGLYRTIGVVDARPLFVIWSTHKSSMMEEVYQALYYLLNPFYWRRV